MPLVSVLLCLAGAVVILLIAGLGILLIAMSGRIEKKEGVWMVVAGGLLLLLCACIVVALTWGAVSFARSLHAAPMPIPPSSPPARPTTASTAAAQPTDTPTARPTAEPTRLPTAQPTPAPTPTPVISHPREMGLYAGSLLPEAQADLDALDDPPLYIIEARVDWDAHKVIGQTSVSITNNEATSLDALYFRLYPNADYYGAGQTEIGTITLDMQAVEFQVDETVLEIRLPRPLASEEQIELIIPFTVTVPRRPDRFGYYDNVMMLGHWYPMLAVYDDEGWNLDPYVEMGDAFYTEVGLYAVYLTTPNDVVVANTGIRVTRDEVSPGEARFTLVSGATRDFALALSPDYETVTRQAGGTRVTSFYLPGDEENGERALDIAVNSIGVFGEYFGPYPYAEFDVAETPFLIEGSPGGMEFPGIVFISTEFYDPDGLYSADMDVVVSHETAHQWWYGVVGNNQVDDPWLDESLASFSEILYLEEIEGRAAAEAARVWWIELPYQFAVWDGDDMPVATSLLEFDDIYVYSGIVYSKGALFLEELRNLVGDETFFAILQRYYETYRYGVAPPDGLQRVIADVTGDDPDALALYDLWILSGETPPGYE